MRLRLVGPVDRLVHEQHVGVTAIPLLAATEPAHADDGQPHRQRAVTGCCPVGLHLARDGVEDGVDRRGGDVGQRLPDLGAVEQSQQVSAGDPQQLAPTQTARDRRSATGVVVATDRGHEFGRQLRRGSRPKLVRAVGRIGHHGDRFGRAKEQIGGVSTAREHQREMLRGRAFVAQQPQVPMRVAE